VAALCDAQGPFFEPRHTAFPDATPPAWDAARRIDPAAFGPGAEWHLHFHAFLVEALGDIVLVDLGVGPHGSAASSWAPVPGRLPAALASEGLTPGDVDVVVLTHLHSDHVGWAVAVDRPGGDDPGRGQPLFPNARHVVQRTELEALAGSPLSRAVIDPLEEAGLIDPVVGEARVAHRVGVTPTPGHTAGHQSVWIGDELLLTGDVLVHPVQLADPAVGYHYEDDAAVARATRFALLDEAAGRGALLGVAHFAIPFLPAGVARRDR
jgi:glyoxylase-like metal-dependent hydrolase (beta-lactamase superfamily II)